MGKTFRYYTILRPLRDRYLDDGASVLALVAITDEGRATDVALIGSPGDPRMIRVAKFEIVLQNLKCGEIPVLHWKVWMNGVGIEPDDISECLVRMHE